MGREDAWEDALSDAQAELEERQQEMLRRASLVKRNLYQAFLVRDVGIGIDYQNLHDYSVRGVGDKPSVFLRDIERHLIKMIEECDVVLGCVAWVTSAPILQALSRKKGVSLLVQKEDFLRSNTSSDPFNWTNRLHAQYAVLPRALDRRDFHAVVWRLECGNDSYIDPVRCVGHHNVQHDLAFPRFHHKFVLFCRYDSVCTCETCKLMLRIWDGPRGGGSHCRNCQPKKTKSHLHPYAVWTGSFNFSGNSTHSLENAVLLRDESSVEAFYQEYLQLVCLSESLDWTERWSTPQYRLF